MASLYDSILRKLLPDFDEDRDDKRYKSSASAVRPPSMQDYVEHRLTELHYSAKDYRFCPKLFGIITAVLLIVLMPYIHIGVFYMKIWVPDKPPIDKRECTCSCFDTIFRGQYETPGPTPYKHVYFNSTATTFKIWVLTVIFILLCYESVKYLVNVYQTSSFRRNWLILYLINIYPHYYTWWSFFSYYNEQFFTFFSHHMFFSITELIVTAIVLNLCSRKNETKTWKIMAILAISLVHIIVSGTDQFIAQFLQGQGRNFQNARNIGLMIPDVLHVVIPAYEFHQHLKRSNRPLSEQCFKEEIIFFVLFISLGTLFGRLM
ncbi:uncharacterized protein LOC101852763 isoform X1 [Aplysia californica]|uniref:Uncharacterized protein LOC101852763 isoform X1 n=1 Tax=Aplysia californica TaxID=6500 RepID=A0ABM0JMJ1_APLCA|nr:uncharacterized protein LOC101852763 isoform X1 [Aplysia californica]